MKETDQSTKEEHPNTINQENLKTFVKNVNTSLIEKNSQNLPNAVQIYSEYGSGKTTLANAWESYSDSDEATFIYCDAYENSMSLCPFTLLQLQIEKWANKTSKNSGEKWEKLATAFDLIFNTATNLTTMGHTGYNPNIDIKLAHNAYNAFKKDIEKSPIDKFKSLLQKLISETHKKLIIIIDELDRCNPIFCIDFLEKIAHIFNIENIKFIFMTTKKSLTYCIQNIYGYDELLAHDYLERFFLYSIKLPHISRDQFLSKTIEKYTHVNNLITENIVTGEIISGILNFFKNYKGGLIPSKDFSLREIEKLINKANISFSLVENTAEIVKKNTDLSAEVIKILNSQFFYFIIFYLAMNIIPHKKLAEKEISTLFFGFLDTLDEKTWITRDFFDGIFGEEKDHIFKNQDFPDLRAANKTGINLRPIIFSILDFTESIEK